MKQKIMFCLFFYIHINMLFAESIIQVPYPISKITQNQTNDTYILDVYTTLRVIKKMHRDVESEFDQLSSEDKSLEQDYMFEIITILMGTYEKIVNATVTHYLMVNIPPQQNLQNTIGIIVAEDIFKIMNILGRRVLSFICDEKMNWQQKIWHCTWITGIIIIMKLSIDQIPKPEKQNDNLSKTPIHDNDSITIHKD